MCKKITFFYLLISIIIILLNNCNVPGSNEKENNGINFFDTDPVEIKSYSPNSNYINKEDIKVKIEFTKDMNKDSVEKKAFSFEENGKSVLGDFKWSGADKELSFTPNKKCEWGKNYRIIITTDAEDVNGNDLKDKFIHDFKLGNDEDSPYVILNQCTPAPNSELNADQLTNPIIIVFSEAMDKKYPYKYVTVTSSGEVDGIYEWLDDNNNVADQFSDIPCSRLRFVPNKAFVINEYYKVNINNQITDLQKNPLKENCTYQFRAGNDVVTPFINSVNAQIKEGNNTVNIVLNQNILNENLTKNPSFTIIFSKGMKRDETQKAIKINDPNIKIRYKWETELVKDDKVVITLEENNFFEYKRTYILNINKSAKDLTDNNLDADYYYNFIINNPNCKNPILERVQVISAEVYADTDGDGEEDAWTTDPNFTILDEGGNPFGNISDAELIELAEEEDYVTFSYGDIDIKDTERVLNFRLWFNSTAEIYENSLIDLNNFNFETQGSGYVSLKINGCDFEGIVTENNIDYYIYEIKVIPKSSKSTGGIDSNTSIKIFLKGGNVGIEDLNGNILEKSIEFLILFYFGDIN